MQRSSLPIVALGFWFLMPAGAEAVTRYVNVNNGAPSAPYTSWASAAVTIQDAVDAAAAGDEILVTNGIYAVGGRAVFGVLTNRVVVDKALSLRSVQGPDVTVIQGNQVPGTTNGDTAVRCVYLTNGAFLAGFTLRGGATRAGAGDYLYENSGGGLLGGATSAVVSNCVFIGNSAHYGGGGAAQATVLNCVLSDNQVLQNRGGGGGAYRCTLRNCAVTENRSMNTAGGGVSYSTAHNCFLSGNLSISGGGSVASTLNNCTIVGNRATSSAGGVIGGTANNCIVYYNLAWRSDDNHTTAEAPKLNFCCTSPLPPTGTGNIAAEPALASASHLSALSSCRGAGSVAYAAGLDLDGESWATPPDIGCDQFVAGSATGSLTAAIVAPYTNIAAGYALKLEALITGRVTASVWSFGDGVIVSNRPYASHAWATAGDYTLRASPPFSRSM